jgi:N-glycosidase YbiA
MRLRVWPQSDDEPSNFVPSTARKHLTREARAVLRRADEGGVPMFVSQNLRRIATENGVAVTEDMTPNAIVEALRNRASQPTIRFYSARERPYGCFSNFSAHGFKLDGAWWPTSEHYFQAQKFAGTPSAEAIRQAPSPKLAAEMGRDRSRPLRPDWEEVTDDVMREAVWHKFQAHPELQAILLGTGDAPIVEAAHQDAYWGCGPDGSGRNQLGKTLMEVRARLRARH